MTSPRMASADLLHVLVSDVEQPSHRLGDGGGTGGRQRGGTGPLPPSRTGMPAAILVYGPAASRLLLASAARLYMRYSRCGCSALYALQPMRLLGSTAGEPADCCARCCSPTDVRLHTLDEQTALRRALLAVGAAPRPGGGPLRARARARARGRLRRRRGVPRGGGRHRQAARPPPPRRGRRAGPFRPHNPYRSL